MDCLTTQLLADQRCETPARVGAKVGANMLSVKAPSSDIWRKLSRVDGTWADAELRRATALG